MPDQIKRIRENNRASQPVFARYLNTSESTGQKWETGAKRPSGMALKLLTVVEKFGLSLSAKFEPTPYQLPRPRLCIGVTVTFVTPSTPTP